MYQLAHPLVIPSGREAFALSYTSTIAECRLSLLSAKSSVLKSVPLPPSSGTRLRYLVPLQKGDTIWGYRFSVPSPAAANGILDLAGAGTTPFVHGFAIEPDGLAVDGSVAVLAASRGSVEARIPSATRDQMAGGIWLLTIGMQPDAAGGAVTLTAEDGRSVVFDVSPSHGPVPLQFARGSVNFLPADVRVAGSVASLEISQLPAEAPIPADPGTMLSWDRSAWRRPDFEVFSWDRFPHVLILDTASYEVQDGLFNRLAFFVEKAGHAGKIEPPAALTGIHGYTRTTTRRTISPVSSPRRPRRTSPLPRKKASSQACSFRMGSC